MAFCMNCGKQLQDSAKYCNNCGTATDIINSTKRKTIYDGELHKCPNCGEILDSFIVNCPSCGFELRGIKATESVRELALKLEAIEEKRKNQKKTSLFAKVYGGEELSQTDEQKVSLIRSFPIPNTKEDIFEFMLLASSNIDLKLYGLGDKGVLTASQRAVSDAWLAKFEQAYQKAQFSFGSSSEFNNIHKIYADKTKKLKRKKWQLPIFLLSTFGTIFLMFGFILLILHLTGSL